MSAKIDLIDLAEACAIVGGNRPISKSYFYESIAAGRLPQPVKIGPHAVRWQRHEMESAVLAMINARPKVKPRLRKRA